MAPSKSRKTRRKRSSKRKRKKRQEDWLESLKRKIEQGPWGRGKVIIEPSRQVKMSEVLEDFIEPYIESADTGEDYRKLLMLAVIAWNVSLLPEEEQQNMVNKICADAVTDATDEMKRGLKDIVNMLIARKKAHFSEYRRTIIEFELIDTERGYHLAVASTAVFSQ